MWKKIPDSLLLGFVSGIVTMSLFYFLLNAIRSGIVKYYQNIYLFQVPKVFLFSVFLNVLLFRFVIISGEKEDFGKGILLATVGVSFVYFYYFLKYHQSII